MHFLGIRIDKDGAARYHSVAGWSSPVARQTHNLKAGGSNPPPATNTSFLPHMSPTGNWQTEGQTIKMDRQT